MSLPLYRYILSKPVIKSEQLTSRVLNLPAHQPSGKGAPFAAEDGFVVQPLSRRGAWLVLDGGQPVDKPPAAEGTANLRTEPNTPGLSSSGSRVNGRENANFGIWPIVRHVLRALTI